MNKVTKETILAEIFEKPELVKILEKYNLPCLWCPMAKQEIQNLKLGKVCEVYQIDVEKLLKDLNKK